MVDGEYTTLSVTPELRTEIAMLKTERGCSYEELLADMKHVYINEIPYRSINEFKQRVTTYLEGENIEFDIQDKKHILVKKNGEFARYALTLILREIDVKNIDGIITPYSTQEKYKGKEVWVIK